MGLWFKLVSYIFLLLFFSIELFCSVKNLVCPYFIFLLVHSSTVVFFLTSPRKLSKGENERALRLLMAAELEKYSADRTLAIHASSFEALQVLDIFSRCKLCSHVSVHRGQGEQRTGDCEMGRQGEPANKRCFSVPGSCCETPFYWW